MAPRRPGARGPSRSSGAPDPERGVVDDEQQREGREQLEQLGRAIDAAQQHDLDQRADARPTISAAATMPPQKPSPPPTLVAKL